MDSSSNLTYTKEDEIKDKKASKETLKIYWACLKPSWKMLIASLILTTMDAVFELLIPYLSGLLITQGVNGLRFGAGLNQPNFYYIWLYSGLIIGLSLFAICAQASAMNIDAKISSDFVERLRNTIFWKAEQFSFSNIGHFPVSKLTTMLSNDCNNIRFFVLMLTRAGFKSPLMILISFVFIFSQSWLIGLITIPLSILSFIIIAIIINKTHPFFIKTQTAIDNVNNNVEEDTEGIREVKAFCREKHMDDKFAKANQDLTDVSFTAFSRMAIVSAITQLAISITIGLIQYFGGWDWMYTATNTPLWLIFNNGNPFNAGELSMLSNFTAAMTMAFSFLSMLLQFYGRAEASKERIDRVLVEPIDISYSPKAKTEDFDPDHLANGNVSFKNACLTYVDDLSKLALDPISIDIPSGKVIGIVGGTGSGKSSFVNLIPRLYDASKGEVIIAGHNIKDYSVQALRNDIGVVLQQNLLFTGTIRSNILWGKPDATDEEIWRALEIAQAADFVRGFKEGLDTPVVQGGKSVSGGQKQRLCIARAIIKNPKILILDDSTSACDMETERKIKEGLFTKLKGTTIFIIAQRISSVKDADEIIVLDNGKEVGRGTHEELLNTCQIYQEIDAIQKKGVGD